jgi:uncharacterized protein (TIGR02996 family)
MVENRCWRGLGSCVAGEGLTRLKLHAEPILSMNDEEAFHAALDANPNDHTTRLVFADWLQERGDPRAEGYRALGVRSHRFHVSTDQVWWLGNAEEPAISQVAMTQPEYVHRHGILPKDWFQAVEGGQTALWCWRKFDHRREAEDAAAFAFAKLPPERRAELLASPPVANT